MVKHWTHQEKKNIADHYKAIGAKELSKLLVGRSESAIFHMAQKIGLKKSHERLREVGRINVGRRKDRQPAEETPPQ